jgi:hypothetical protein
MQPPLANVQTVLVIKRFGNFEALARLDSRSIVK